jgi:hypothetical protein
VEKSGLEVLYYADFSTLPPTVRLWRTRNNIILMVSTEQIEIEYVFKHIFAWLEKGRKNHGHQKGRERNYNKR